jgi:hypothetical protein
LLLSPRILALNLLALGSNLLATKEPPIRLSNENYRRTDENGNNSNFYFLTCKLFFLSTSISYPRSNPEENPPENHANETNQGNCCNYIEAQILMS